jgi:hypothetical protein
VYSGQKSSRLFAIFIVLAGMQWVWIIVVFWQKDHSGM